MTSAVCQSFCFWMRLRISVRGHVCPLFRQSVSPSVPLSCVIFGQRIWHSERFWKIVHSVGECFSWKIFVQKMNVTILVMASVPSTTVTASGLSAKKIFFYFFFRPLLIFLLSYHGLPVRPHYDMWAHHDQEFILLITVMSTWWRIDSGRRY